MKYSKKIYENEDQDQSQEQSQDQSVDQSKKDKPRVEGGTLIIANPRWYD